MPAVIETEGLTKVYGRQAAVDGLTFEVNEGEIFGFLGPNGAGKTTTLLMLLGLTEPTGGKARVLGFDPVREPLKVKRQVGYLPENMGFYDDMTAWENLTYVSRLNGLSDSESRSRIEQALETVGLDVEGDKQAGAYSRGMRQRLGIAELLIKDPKLVFLDEPTLGLDPDGINRMLDLIVSLSRDQVVTLMEEVFAGIKGLKGVHCCGNTDWSLLLATAVDILNLDAYEYAEALALYPDQVGAFLERGGIIAWGIVPASDQVYEETIDSLLERFHVALDLLTGKGLHQDDLLSSALIMPSCGCGSPAVETAERVFRMTGELAQALQERYG